ncbi:hypothetical protein QYF36_021946 [Acer negundo]|nr:hypothetical protein QYF36_021946 [Acer negundo]
MSVSVSIQDSIPKHEKGKRKSHANHSEPLSDLTTGSTTGSRAKDFFMMERIRTHLYSIGSFASSSKLGALRDAASLM